MPLVDRYEHINKLVEQEEFIDSMSVKSSKLKDKLLFYFKGFTAFCVSLA